MFFGGEKQLQKTIKNDEIKNIDGMFEKRNISKKGRLNETKFTNSWNNKNICKRK